MEKSLEGLLVCVIGAPSNGRFVCEGEQTGVKRTRNEQDFLEESIRIVWTTSPSFLLLLLLLLLLLIPFLT
jgi:hypothetical protein